MLRIKKNDKIIIISGKNKGKIGIVKKQIKKEKKIIIENLNIAKKNTKANPNKNKSGGILNIEAPIYVSKVMLLSSDNKKSKISFYKNEGKKKRRLKINQEVIK